MNRIESIRIANRNALAPVPYGLPSFSHRCKLWATRGYCVSSKYCITLATQIVLHSLPYTIHPKYRPMTSSSYSSTFQNYGNFDDFKSVSKCAVFADLEKATIRLTNSRYFQHSLYKWTLVAHNTIIVSSTWSMLTCND